MNSNTQLQRLNWQYLENNYSGMIEDIFALYMEHVDVYIQNIQNAITNKNSHDIARAAHALKGASANIGAEKLAYTCKMIEESGNAKQLASISQQLSTLELELSELKQSIEVYLNERKG